MNTVHNLKEIIAKDDNQLIFIELRNWKIEEIQPAAERILFMKQVAVKQ